MKILTPNGAEDKPPQKSPVPFREIQQLIIVTGMMVIFGVVCLVYVKSGPIDQLLPFLAGLMGTILGYFFGKQPPGKEDKGSQ